MSEIANVAYAAVITVTRFVSDPYWPNGAGFHAGVVALEIRYEISQIGNGSRTEENRGHDRKDPADETRRSDDACERGERLPR